MACDEDIKLISSKKQTIIQGIHTTKPYTNYLFEITLRNAVDLRIDSVFIYDSSKIMKINHQFTKRKNNKNYKLSAAAKEGNYTIIDTNSTTKEKVMIYYQANKKSNQLEITSFEEETLTLR
jgi:hypothetical protein